VLRIRDFYPGSEFFPSRIPDPGQKDSGSRIRIRIQEFKYFKTKKLLLSSRKYDPGSSTKVRIPDPVLDFLHIPDPGSRVKRAPDPGSRSANTAMLKETESFRSIIAY
jgi:hypothetical protein